jgi:hypothetical protein
MAGIELSDPKRSALMAALMQRQQGRTGEENINAVQAMANLGAEFLDGIKMKRILKEEDQDNKRNASNDEALTDALLGNAPKDFSGRTIQNEPAGDPAQASDPTKTQVDSTDTAVQVMAGISNMGNPAPDGRETVQPRNLQATLAHTLRQNPDSEFAQSVRNQLVSNAMAPGTPEDKPTFTNTFGAATKNIMNAAGDVVVKKGASFPVTVRRNADGNVDYYLDEGDEEVPLKGSDYERDVVKTRNEEVTGLDDKAMSKSIGDYNNSIAFMAKTARQANKMVAIAGQNPTALNKPGGLARFTNESIRLAQGALKIFDPNGSNELITTDGSGMIDFDWSSFDNIQGIAMDATELQSLAYGVAYGAAVSIQGSRPSDQDIQAFLDQIGANSSDFPAFANTIAGFVIDQTQQINDKAFLDQIPQDVVTRGSSLMNPLLTPFTEIRMARDPSQIPGYSALSPEDKQLLQGLTMQELITIMKGRE